MTAEPLLDVNVLVALFDPDHVHHDAAHRWFGVRRQVGWASCPLTENALVRILSNSAYTGSFHRPHEIARRLHDLRAQDGHVFWPDDVSLADRSLFRLENIQGHKQLTDVYLLGLARRRGAALATFDGSIPLPAVVGARPRHLVVIPA